MSAVFSCALPDSHFAEKLYRKNKNLFDRVLDKLKKFVKNLREYFAHVNPNTKVEAAALKENTESGMRYLEKIVEAFDKTAEAAVENYQQGATESAAESKAQYKTRGKYWRPDLKDSEWKLLEHRMAEEIGSGENYLDDATKWVYAEEKGVQVFALYGVGNGTEATPLYAVGGKRAAVANELILSKMEDEKNGFDGNRADISQWVGGVRSNQKYVRRNLDASERKGATARGIDKLHGGAPKSDTQRIAGGNTEDQRGVKEKFSLREEFSGEIDAWRRAGMPEGERFTLGSTGPVLQGLGAIESDIYMEGDKIKKIMQDHPEMTLAEIKKVPQILENPALILKSEGRGKSGANSRLVCFGLTKAQNGQPVMTVMDLRPRENGFVVDDMQKVNSAYTKNNPMAFIQKSDVVYADKKRAIPLLRTTGLTISSQRLLQNGYIGSISYKGSSVNIQGVPFSSVVKIEENTGKDQHALRDVALSDREILEEKQTQRQGYLQVKRDILSGREAKELNAEERDVLRGMKKAGRHLAMLADFGAEGGSRTLARVFKPPTPLAGEPLRPLGYFCRNIWRSLAERVGFEPTDAFTSPVFKTGAFDHSAISPCVKVRSTQTQESFYHRGKALSIKTKEEKMVFSEKIC